MHVCKNCTEHTFPSTFTIVLPWPGYILYPLYAQRPILKRMTPYSLKILYSHVYLDKLKAF